MTDRQVSYARLAMIFILAMLSLCGFSKDKVHRRKSFEYTQEYAFSGVRSIVVKSESSKFYSHRVTGQIDVKLVQSKDERVVFSIVRASDVDVFKIEKIGNTLKINAGDKNLDTTGHPGRPEAVVTIYTKDINRIEMGGANALTATGYFTGRSMNLNLYGASEVMGLSGRWNDLNIKLSGASDLNMVKVESSNVNLVCEDASDFVISGKGKVFKITASGSTDVEAENFPVKDVDAKLKGAADVTVNASGTVKYTATGSADFDWVGAPQIIRN